MSNIEYLYRYTSLESLALILKSRQIRLNPLDKMGHAEDNKQHENDSYDDCHNYPYSFQETLHA